MQKQEVRIRCEGSHQVRLSEIHPIQKDLKDLSEKNYQKLKKEILTEGYIAPFMVWKDNILDGTQRYRALNKMQDDGIKLPEFFPAIRIDADHETAARRIILAISSNYGSMTGDGLFEFLSESHIGFQELDTRFEFDAIKFDDFQKEFYLDQDNISPIDKKEKLCPHCNGVV